MSATIERPQTIPDLNEEEMERLRTVRERQMPQPPLTVTDALTVERFWAWSETKPDGKIVGCARESTSCPIHTYLTETFRGRYGAFDVGYSCAFSPYLTEGERKSVPLPQWAKLFIHNVDRMGGAIFAYQVRAVLREMSILRR